MGLKNWVHPETSIDTEERLHPQPRRLGHLFYRRYPRSIRPAVFQSRTPAPQTPNSPLSPPLASILCCFCSYYRYAPAKCKTSICHLSAHSSVKTSFMPFPHSFLLILFLLLTWHHSYFRPARAFREDFSLKLSPTFHRLTYTKQYSSSGMGESSPREWVQARSCALPGRNSLRTPPKWKHCLPVG